MTADPRSGINEDGTFVPAFEGQRPPFEKGNTLQETHGVGIEARVVPLARNHRRRVLRQIGLRASEVDPIGRAHLDAFTRSHSKIELIDRWVEEHGLIRADGSLQPCMSLYVSLTNSARSSLKALEAHLRARGGDPVARLDGYIRENYGVDDG